MARADREAALDLLDIEGWLSQYVKVKDGGGSERRVETCPKCGDNRYKLYINVEIRRWICYYCEWGKGEGDFVKLMAALSGRPDTAIRIELEQLQPPGVTGDLAKHLVEIFDEGVLGTTLASSSAIAEVALPGFTHFGGTPGTKVLAYALGRGLTEQEVKDLRLRAAQEVPAKRSSVKGPWLVFPIYAQGKPVAWQGRVVRKSNLSYLSSESIKQWLWPLDQHFFGSYNQEFLCLVEGVFDAWGLIKNGIPALCTFGKSMSKEQLEILKNLQPREVIFVWDADASIAMARAVDAVSYNFARTSIVDVEHPGLPGMKIDGGDALKTPWVGDWIKHQINVRMDVRSPEFFQWRMKKM